MSFDTILAQEPAVRTLLRALDANRVHHAYRFEGPDGVGKEMAAFALTESLICGAADATPGAAACRRRVRTCTEAEPRVPLHPDVILVQRGLYRAVLGSPESAGISIEQIRRIVLPRAGYPPHEGRALVFIVRNADELTVQAANALLKTLEEPGERTHFVLLTSRPQRLLATVLSRTVPVRFGLLPDTVVATILERRGLPTAVAPLAQGSASLALQLADEERTQAREEFVARTLAAIDAEGLVSALALSDTRPAERFALADLLAHLAQTFAMQGRETIGAQPFKAEQAARRHQAVLLAMQQLERNGQPALVLESMVANLRRA